MKFVLAVCFALFGGVLSLTPQVRDREDLVYQFMYCFNKSLDSGLEAAGIAPQNPLSLTALNGNHSFLGVEFDLYNNYLNNLLVYNLTNIKGKLSEDGQSIFYNFSMYWPSFLFTGNFSYHSLLHHEQGNYTLEIKDVTFDGFWNMTLATEDRLFNIDDYELVTHTDDVEFRIEPVPGILDLLETPLDKLIKTTINNFPVPIVSAFVQNYFNTRWLHHNDYILAILENCNA